MLQRRGPGERHRRKSALGDWVLLLPRREAEEEEERSQRLAVNAARERTRQEAEEEEEHFRRPAAYATEKRTG